MLCELGSLGSTVRVLSPALNNMVNSSAKRQLDKEETNFCSFKVASGWTLKSFSVSEQSRGHDPAINETKQSAAKRGRCLHLPAK